MEQQILTIEDDDCLAISADPGGVTVLYPGNFFDWDSASQFLSERLGKPAFSFHIHDSDLWMYELYEHGEVADQFNPIPDYWDELDDEECQAWQGDAATVARCVPGIAADQIARYLVRWGDNVFESSERKKAYPTDEFHYGDDWQLVDFMRKLGFRFPVNDQGDILGITYRFECDTDDEL